MQCISALAPEVLDAQINKWTVALKRGHDPEARSILRTLLLEKERRKLVAFSPTQLAAAIRCYKPKGEEGRPGAADLHSYPQGQHAEEARDQYALGEMHLAVGSGGLA